MIATIVNNQDILISNVTAWEEELLDNHFSAENPNSGRYIDNAQYQSWDGVYRRYSRKKKRLARPFLGELRSFCKKKDLQVAIQDVRPPSKYRTIDAESITFDFLDGITLKDFQVEGIRRILTTEVGLFSITTGGGKCLGKDTPVMMYDGSIKMVQDVVVGDMLMGDDSKPRKVLSTCFGTDDLYRVKQKNGDDYIVNSAHVLSLKRTNKRVGDIRGGEIEDVSINEYLNTTNFHRHILKGYKVDITFDEQSVDLDPYLVGLWLGDGISADTQVCVSEEDHEILAYLGQYCNEYGLELVKYEDLDEAMDIYALRLYEGIHRPKGFDPFEQNPVKQAFKKYGLLNNKHVPVDYKLNSRENRLKLLAGFLDADGELNDRRDKFSTTHRRGCLIDSIVFIARSLGFRVTQSPCFKECTTTGYVGEYDRVTISGHLDQIPTILERKRAKSRKSPKNPLVCGIEVQYLGQGDYYGFEIDGNKRFLLGDFTVTHNTEIACAIIKALQQPTVVIAEQTIVIDQICNRLVLRHVCDEPGVFYAGKQPNGQLVIVGTIQSLVSPKSPPDKPVEKNYQDNKGYKRALVRYESKLKAYKTRKKNAKILRNLVSKCDLLLVDEADLAVGNTYKSLFRHWFKGRRRYGFTGTPFDDDKPVQKLILQEHLGSVIYKQDRHAVQDAGLIVPLRYYMLAFGEDGNKKDARAYDIAINEEMVYSNKFHTMIASICARFPNDGTLILVERDDLGHALNEMIPKSQFYHGKTPRNQRSEMLRVFERREKNVLIGGKNVRRGLDLKGGCENLILATGGKLVSELEQRMGRARRLNDRGEARVFDFYFLNNKYLYAHSRKRLRAVAVDMGIETHIIYRDGFVDGESLVRSRFRRPRALQRGGLRV